MKRLIIEQLKEGFNFIDEDGEKYAVLESGIVEKIKAYFGLIKHKEKEHEAPIAARQQEKYGAGSHPAGATFIVRPSDLHIPKFEYDNSKMQSYENIFFQEFQDGRVVLEYNMSHYYTTKKKF